MALVRVRAPCSSGRSGQGTVSERGPGVQRRPDHRAATQSIGVARCVRRAVRRGPFRLRPGDGLAEFGGGVVVRLRCFSSIRPALWAQRWRSWKRVSAWVKVYPSRLWARWSWTRWRPPVGISTARQINRDVFQGLLRHVALDESDIERVEFAGQRDRPSSSAVQDLAQVTAYR